jgi:carboxymethylenebutenolidase
LIAVIRAPKFDLMTKVRLATVGVFILSFGPSLAISGAETGRPVVTGLSLSSGGHRIRIDKYTISGSGKRPAILVLHGAGGTLLDGPEMRRVARQLAQAGNPIYLVHYFNRTGTIFGLDAGMQKNFAAWLATVRDCIGFAQRDSADPSPVGIYGYSLGGFLALSAASDNPAVGAVVEHAGGAWNGKVELLKRMPPVLIVHGEKDQRVPFQKYAPPLVGVLRQRGATFKTRFFPEEGHVFTSGAMSKVRRDAAEFFRQHLERSN